MPLSQLQPQPVWHWFSQICRIPHPSKHEEELAQYIVNWATSQGLSVKRDRVGNVIIKKPASPGLENRKGVILQAHLDMVPQKNSDKEHDFTRDPIDAYVDGEWVTAKGTTLGADNGIGLCASLAVLADTTIEHGPLEALFTIDEEAGMTGAFGLEAGTLEGEILLNTDSEDEGEVYMGCAGGVDANISFNKTMDAAPEGHRTLRINVSGLRGGHSGVDIHLGRGNANKVITRLLMMATDNHHIRLAAISGGSLRNAIAREADATVMVPNTMLSAFLNDFTTLSKVIGEELKATEPDLLLTIDEVEQPASVFSEDLQQRLLAALYGCPHGVFRMSDDIEGVVETSNNLGVINTENERIYVQCLIRSLQDSCRRDAQTTIGSIFKLAGAQVEFSGAYPGWQPNTDSQVMTVVRETYQQMFGELPKIMVIHAGLECGLFKDAYPQWDMVSFGPTIRFPHSPDEKVNIDTVGRFWQLMLAILKNIPEKA